LESLSGIGPVIAKAIIQYRLENGPFEKIEEIQEVSGIGPVTFEKIRPNITIRGTSGN
jgi:competence protein ComEA